MRSASTSRRQLAATSAIRARPVVDQADGERRQRRDRRNRADRAATRSRSGHRATASARPRCHGGSPDLRRHGAELPRARSSPITRRWPIAGSPGQVSGATAKSCSGGRSPGSGNRGGRAASDRTGSGTGVPGVGEEWSGWDGTRPPTGSPGRRDICDQRHSSSGFGPALVAELLRGGEFT